MAQQLAWRAGPWVWLALMGAFVVVAAIPPLVAARRRIDHVGLVARLVAVPSALTVAWGVALPVWVVAWVVGLAVAIGSPGRMSEAALRREAAEARRQREAEWEALRGPKPSYHRTSFGTDRRAWGGGEPSRPQPDTTA